MRGFASSLMLDVDMVPGDFCSDPNQCRKFVIDLCERIHMKRHGEPFVEHFGEGHLEGWTVVQLIETSHVVAHFIDPPNVTTSLPNVQVVGALHLDVCSCGDLNPAQVVKLVETSWPGARIRVRNGVRRLPRLEQGEEEYDSISAAYDTFYGDELCVREDEIVAKKLELVFPNRVLDLGCGTGAGHRIVTDAMKAPPRYYVGIDHSSTMLDRFWTSCYDWKWASNGSRYFRDVVRDREVTLELHRRELAGEWDHGLGKFDLILSLWSLSYLNHTQLMTLAVKAKQLVDPDTPWVVVLYGDAFVESGRYLKPYAFSSMTDKQKLVQYSTSRSIVRAIADQGWRVESVEGLTGPWTRRGPKWLWRASEYFDRKMVHPYDSRWLCQLVELRRE